MIIDELKRGSFRQVLTFFDVPPVGRWDLCPLLWNLGYP